MRSAERWFVWLTERVTRTNALLSGSGLLSPPVRFRGRGANSFHARLLRHGSFHRCETLLVGDPTTSAPRRSARE